MKETLRHLDIAIEALRRTQPTTHIMMYELERCRQYLLKYAYTSVRTPDMFAEYRE